MRIQPHRVAASRALRCKHEQVFPYNALRAPASLLEQHRKKVKKVRHKVRHKVRQHLWAPPKIAVDIGVTCTAHASTVEFTVGDVNVGTNEVFTCGQVHADQVDVQAGKHLGVWLRFRACS